MIVTPAGIAGAFCVALEPIGDDRGYFARTFCFETLRSAGAAIGALRQTSISYNARRATLRGLHWQAEPSQETKLVRPAAGRIFDVIVDLRPASATYCKWIGLELDPMRGLVVPRGCAHGFITLEDNCSVEYAMDADHAPAAARGARWNDPAFAVTWPIEPAIISDRDRAWPDFGR